MAGGRIPSDFIDHLIASTDIVDVISRSVALKKRGNSHTACCPFHHEKTPSFHVSQQKQIYHCFGCGVSGNVITFLREYDHLDFLDAVEELASLKGLDVPYEKGSDETQPRQDYSNLYTALSLAAKFYRWQLKHHPDSQKAIQYIKDRQLSATTAQRFNLGYAPDEWRVLSDTLKEKYTIEVLSDAGLTIQKSPNKYYDRFRSRLIFPIRNRQGKIIGFGGRLLINEPNQPKYLNSPETPVFHKGNELYGLYEIRQLNTPIPYLLVVEGYMDVIGLAQHNFNFAVATLGTALTNSHIKRLFRETHSVIFCFDGDEAGQKAAMKSLVLTLPELEGERNARFLTLPDDEDPDSYIRKYGLQEFQKNLDQADTPVDFLFKNALRAYPKSLPDFSAKLMEHIKSLLQGLPENSYTILIKKRLSDETGATLEQINYLMQTGSTTYPEKSEPQPLKKVNLTFNPNKLSFLDRTLHFILSAPSTCQVLLEIDLSAHLQHPILEIISHCCEAYRFNASLNSASLIQTLLQSFPQYETYFYQLAAIDLKISDKAMQQEAYASLLKIIKDQHGIMLKKLLEKSKSYPLTSEEKSLLKELLHKNNKP